MTRTDPGCKNRPLKSEKRPTDREINEYIALKNVPGLSPTGSGVPMPKSTYGDTFSTSRGVEEDIRRAFRPSLSPYAENGPYNGGQMLVTRSSAQSAHCGAPPLGGCKMCVPTGTLGIGEAPFDYCQSTYKREHGSGIGPLGGAEKTSPSRSQARRTSKRKLGAVPDSLEALLNGLHPLAKSASMPHMMVPISLVGTNLA
mmetsp:Transcript_29646/g.94993  ORF Transcript_29646/g.94993 Transcript_29646/m.94993 type:complete len:200 (+) Transcript_29646:221-820(+)